MEQTRKNYTFSLKDLAYGGGLFIASAAGAAWGAHAMHTDDMLTSELAFRRLTEDFTESLARNENRANEFNKAYSETLLHQSASCFDCVSRECEYRIAEALRRYEASRVKSAAAEGDPAAIMQLIHDLQERMDRSNRDLRDHFSGIISQYDTMSEKLINRIQEQFRQETSTCQRRMREIASSLLQKVDENSNDGKKLLEAFDASFSKFDELNQQFKKELMTTLQNRSYGSERSGSQKSFDPEFMPYNVEAWKSNVPIGDEVESYAKDADSKVRHPAKSSTHSPPQSPGAARRAS